MSKDELMAPASGPLLFGALVTVEQCLGNCGGSLTKYNEVCTAFSQDYFRA